MSSLELGRCMRLHCDAPVTTAKDDPFCQPCWRKLPRATRVELVRLRNAARLSKGATSKPYVVAILPAGKWLDDRFPREETPAAGGGITAAVAGSPATMAASPERP